MKGFRMGHYDTCRPENCAGCGQAKGVVWGCGRRNCSTYHQFLKVNDPAKYRKLMAKLKVEQEAAEERRVMDRRKERIKQRRAEVAEKKLEQLRKKALSKLTAAERKALGI